MFKKAIGVWIIILSMILSVVHVHAVDTQSSGEEAAGQICDENESEDVKSERKVPILVYHNIMDSYCASQSSVQISPKEFEAHMLSLDQAGYHTITFQQYNDYVTRGQELPDNPIILTFDDGYSSNYEYAYPVLKKYNMKATIFVLTGRMGAVDEVTYPHFTWEEAREMQQSGVIDIQSHSDLHPDMTRVEIGRAQLELRRSRYLIRKELQKPCEVFAYPYGLYNSDLQELAEKAGYKIQVIVGDQGANTRKEGLKQLKRLTAFGGTSGEELLAMIEENMQ